MCSGDGFDPVGPKKSSVKKCANPDHVGSITAYCGGTRFEVRWENIVNTCRPKYPFSVVYENLIISLFVNVTIQPIVPETQELGESTFRATLPQGLEIDKKSGIISGTPTEIKSSTNYEIICTDEATIRNILAIEVTSKREKRK